MSELKHPATLDADQRRTQIEMNGIEVIDESERTAKPSDLFWPWFAANVSVFGISYAAFVYGFGVSFVQAILVATIGITISFALVGIIAIAGKRGSAPTMILSRAAFGVTGQRVPGYVSWLVSIGWETFLAIMATLATATVFERLGWGGGTTTKILAAAFTAAVIVIASVAGYHIIMRLQSILTWATGAMTIAYIGLTLGELDWAAITAIPSARCNGRSAPRDGDDRLRPRLDQHRKDLAATSRGTPPARRSSPGTRSAAPSRP